MISQTLIEELKQQNIWLIYFKTITKNGNATKTPRSANNTATGADKAHADTLVTCLLYTSIENSRQTGIHLR